MDKIIFSETYELNQIVFKLLDRYGKSRQFVHVLEINKRTVVGGGEVLISDICQQPFIIYNQ